MKLGDQDKKWAPNAVCKPCVEHLREWIKGKRKGLKFGIPKVWREPRNYVDDCYFCIVIGEAVVSSQKPEQKCYIPSSIQP